MTPEVKSLILTMIAKNEAELVRLRAVRDQLQAERDAIDADLTRRIASFRSLPTAADLTHLSVACARNPTLTQFFEAMLTDREPEQVKCPRCGEMRDREECDGCEDPSCPRNL